jgi:hypothetical protein
MFVLNDDYDAENLLYFIKKQKIDQQNSNFKSKNILSKLRTCFFLLC